MVGYGYDLSGMENGIAIFRRDGSLDVEGRVIQRCDDGHYGDQTLSEES